MKNIDTLRMEAAWCWHFSSKVAPFRSPLLAEIEHKMEVLIGGGDSGRLPTFEEVSQKCDELILVEDASVRVMALTAMFLMNYISPHVDVIANLLGSEEIGTSYSWVGGKELGQDEALRRKAEMYLIWVLDIRETDLFFTLEEKVKHWSKNLGYDSELDDIVSQEPAQEHESFIQGKENDLDLIQAAWDREMNKEGFQETSPDPFYDQERVFAPRPPVHIDWDRYEFCFKEVNGEGQEVRRFLSDEEYRKKQENRRKNTWRSFRNDVSEYIERYTLTSFAEDRRRQVREALEKISEHAFCKEKDMSKVALVIDLFGRLVQQGRIPARWILDASEDAFPKSQPQ